MKSTPPPPDDSDDTPRPRRAPAVPPRGIVEGEERELGGINLNPNILDLKIRRDKNNVPVPLDISPQQIQQIQIDGLKPVIINIIPVYNIPLILGATEEEDTTPSDYLSGELFSDEESARLSRL